MSVKEPSMDTAPTGDTGRPVIPRNDYSVLDPPQIGRWSPELGVSVIVPAYGNQQTLDLCLAALASQSYPPELTEVIVVDDGSAPGLRLSETAPKGTRIIANPGPVFGIASAVNTGARAASNDVILRLDSDIIVNRHHVETHMRWHHLVDYATVIGKVSIVADPLPTLTPASVHEAVEDNRAWDLFDGLGVDPRWSAKLIDKYDELKDLEDRAFLVANGASVSFSRFLYESAGGLDPAMKLGEDTEFAYRLAQSGSVFIPDKGAECWHLGVPQMRSREEEGRRYREPGFANRIPVMRQLREQPGVAWSVPYADVVVDTAGAPFEAVRDTVFSVLGGTLADTRVTLVGSWSALDEDTRTPLDDPRQDLRLIRQAFEGDSRVRYVEQAPPTSAPAPFRLTLPAGVVLTHDALREFTAVADRERTGRINFAMSGRDEPTTAVFDRTAALARALHVGSDGGDLNTVIGELWGVHWQDGDDWIAREFEELETAPRFVSLLKENERLSRDCAKQRSRADDWKDRAAAARKSAAQWEQAAGRWERSAAEWERKAQSSANRPRPTFLRRLHAKISRRDIRN